MRPITGTVPAARICTASSFPENGDEFSPCCIPPGEREPIPPFFCFTAFPDADTALDFILQNESYGFDKEHIYAVGHSLGGFVCGQLTARRTEIRGAALLMPCNIGRLPQIAQEDPAAYRIICDVLDDSADWLTGTSGEALLREALDHSGAFALENQAQALKEKRVLCIGGTLDLYTPPQLHGGPLAQAVRRAGGTLFREVTYPTDHFFADYRLAVAGTVTEFLKGQLPQ